MLILCELLSLADHAFVTEAKEQFMAVNQSCSGEISFTEFDEAMKQCMEFESQSPEEAKVKETKALFDKINKVKTDDTVDWSEWQIALAYETQLNQKNLRNVFQYLNLKSNKAGIKLKHLKSSMKPHIFRLKLDRGTEKRVLDKMMCDLDARIKGADKNQEDQPEKTQCEDDLADSASYLDPSQQDEEEEKEFTVPTASEGLQRQMTMDSNEGMITR